MKNPLKMKSPRFILLDDDLCALEMAKMIIRNYSRYAEIITFSTAKEAMDYFEAGHFMVKHKETVFLTDLHMPEIDGFTVLDRMENTFQALKDRLHIFVVSAAACPEEILKVSNYRCVIGFLNKPLSTTKMEQVIDAIQYPL
jgi:response regulator of citrate/malate metabolism